MGKSGSKVLIETSVDGVQAQVKAATLNTIHNLHTQTHPEPNWQTHIISVCSVKTHYPTVSVNALVVRKICVSW